MGKKKDKFKKIFSKKNNNSLEKKTKMQLQQTKKSVNSDDSNRHFDKYFSGKKISFYIGRFFFFKKKNITINDVETKRNRSKMANSTLMNKNGNVVNLKSKKIGKNFNIYDHKIKILLISVFLLLFSSFNFKINEVNGKTKFDCTILDFNKGLDFAGGLSIEAKCEKCDSDNVIANIKKEASKQINSSVSCQQINDNFLFKTTSPKDYDKTYAIFKDILSKNDMMIINVDYVSPQMTKAFISDSIFACIFAFACIGIYMITRFNYRFAFASLLTLVYDVLMVLAFIGHMRIEVCLITLTALLTIIGYCINDKIVIFDRIRENLTDTTKTVSDLIKESSKSVLLRSVLTSLTTIIIAISLLFFNDRSIYEFGITVIYGIFIGTISSLLIAPSLLLVFHVKHKKPSIHKSPMFYAS